MLTVSLIVVAGIATLLLGKASAQQLVSDKVAPITLRSRIALPGVYGRMDHYAWDSKRQNLIVDAHCLLRRVPAVRERVTGPRL